MPDDLPPLEPQPDSPAIPADVMQQLQHSSQWAGTFGGSDTNISQRARHNQDIMDYADALTNARAQAQQQLLQTNQTAQNLFIRTQQLQQKEMMDNARFKLDAARMVQQGATERRKAIEATAQASDTAAFNNHMAAMIQGGVKPQSADWKLGVADGLSKYPHVNQQDVMKFGASLFPGENLDPEEILSRVHDIQSKDPNTQVSINPKGQVSVVSKPTELNPAQHRAALADQMKDDRLRDSELQKQIDKLTTDHPFLTKTTGPFEHEGTQYFGNSLPDDTADKMTRVTPTTKDAYDRYQAALKERAIIGGRHQTLQERMSQLYTSEPTAAAPSAPSSQTAPAASAPERIATNPKTGEKIVFRGGQWQPLK
jgi:hypothetical protein